MTKAHTFTLVSQRDIPEIDSRALLYRHAPTGARLLSITNQDENKVFGVSFRTPPKDSTGVAHILEHSVLCGSDKYPVKEPFVELLKGSLKTFLNAFTFPDKTCYPVASTHHQDFYNLIDVYLDAVFHPLITRSIFMQEGWHYELDSTAGPLTMKGVVYNEMKGAYSSPDSVLAELSQQSLFPGSTYGLDSGGHPETIPSLTYEAFQDFHRAYYHPSNAWFYFYGDDDPEKRLVLLEESLAGYGELRPDSAVALPKSFPQKVEVREPYAAGSEDAKSMATMNWLLPETIEPQLNLSFQILEEVLVGMPSSPLRKALLDSGLGEDLAGVGMESDILRIYFSTGLKGVAPGDEEKVFELIISTLKKLAAGGIEADLAEAAVNRVEFALRENNTGSFPRGLSLMVRALSTWLYDADPLALVAFEEPLRLVKERLGAGELIFEELINGYLLGNPHRSTVVLTPDTGLAARREAEEKKRLARVLDSMDQAERQEVVEGTALLRSLQEAPDSPESLAAIPRLQVSDLPPDEKKIPGSQETRDMVLVQSHPIPSRGVVYLELAFDLAGLSKELIPWVPLFGRALVELGTSTEDYVSLNRRIAAKTGGIGPAQFTAVAQDGRTPVTRLFLRAKALADKTPDLAAILIDLLTDADLGNRERFTQMVLEAKARSEQRMVPMGHVLAGSRLSARFNGAAHAAELMHGASQLFFLRQAAKTVREGFDAVQSVLEELRGQLISRARLAVSVTSDEEELARFEPRLAEILDALPTGQSASGGLDPAELPAKEGLTIPAQVNYVGKAVDLPSLGYAPSGADRVVSRFLRTGYLWDRVRVRGGAYGAFSSLDLTGGVFSMISYRDPNLAGTLKVFDGAADHLRHLELSEDELSKAVIGMVSDLDAYMLPDAQGFSGLTRLLRGRSEEQLQKERDQVLSVTRKDFRNFAEAAQALADKGEVVVIGGESALKEAVGQGIGLSLTKVL